MMLNKFLQCIRHHSVTIPKQAARDFWNICYSDFSLFKVSSNKIPTCCSFATKTSSSDANKRNWTNAKGTVDRSPVETVHRQHMLQTIIECFKRHGGERIETPDMELREILLNKYGDESKLIFNVIEDDDLISLRYDLTVPLARYLAMNDITNMKCYHIGKVYRRENPSVMYGRYREFTQCDFDIIGDYDSMIPDSECVRIIDEILNELEINNFSIKVNHRQILNGLFEICGIPSRKFASVCHCIDKLDKKPWEVVRNELISEHNLEHSVADKLGQFIRVKGHLPLVQRLSKDVGLCSSKSFEVGLESMRCLLTYCEHFGLKTNVIFDLSLARGLEYYTGAVFEAVINDSSGSTVEVGSIAGGGRYDELIGSFHPLKKRIPCVGLSIGIERILFMKKASKLRTIDTDVYVASPQKHFEEERMKICKLLWNANIKCDMSPKKNPKLLNQLQYCEEMQIPFAVIIGESELENNIVKIRHISTRKEWK